MGRRSRCGSYQARRDQVLLRDNYICHYCSIKLVPTVKGVNRQNIRDNTATADHVVPYHINRCNAMFNMVACCNKCNNDFEAQEYKCFCNFCKNARIRIEMRELVWA